MFLRNLFEASASEVAIIFGRFNPPHKGHRAAWEMASQSPIWYVGTNESTVGPKDPLPYDIKVEAMKAIWPEVASHIMPETSWLTMASKIYEQYPKATLLCLTDEDWVTKTIQQYNGKEGPHGYYNFAKIEQKPTPRLSSATALRDAVSKGDREAFAQAAGVPADTKVAGKPFFDLVAEYLLPYASAPKKVAKKKVPAPVEGVEEARKANTASARAELANRPRKELSDKEKEDKKKESDDAWDKLMQYATDKKKDVAEGKDPCWKNYKQIGMKKKGGKQVPNCVPEDAAGVGTITKQNTTKDVNKGTLRKMMKAYHLTDDAFGTEPHRPARAGSRPPRGHVAEMPIKMNPADPMNPMIYGHEKANPAELKTRMLRASSQLKDLAARAANASPAEWQSIAANFEELKMNVEQIRHAIDELAKRRKRGGIGSRGIDKNIG